MSNACKFGRRQNEHQTHWKRYERNQRMNEQLSEHKVLDSIYNIFGIIRKIIKIEYQKFQCIGRTIIIIRASCEFGAWTSKGAPSSDWRAQFPRLPRCAEIWKLRANRNV